MEAVDHWKNISDEEDDDYEKIFTENTSPLGVLAALCYVIMSLLTVQAVRSTSNDNTTTSKSSRHKKGALERFLEESLKIRAEYSLEVCFGIGAILEFLGEELKLHPIMRSAKKQVRLSNACAAIALHLYVLSSMSLLRIKAEGVLEKVGSLFLIVGSALELAMFYLEFIFHSKVSNGVIVSGNLMGALLWFTNAVMDVLGERYCYEESDSSDDEGDDEENGESQLEEEPILAYLRHELRKRNIPLRVV
eukprot:scaffold2334_cov118-Cylindrotheca_fusiformis.AAC.34